MSLLDIFKSKIDACMGIDVGTNILKIVELKKEKERLMLGNYGIATPVLKEGSTGFKTSALSAKDLADLIKQVLKEAQIKTKHAVISLPILSSFSILIDLPLLPEKELIVAIPFEARKYIPVPIEEVTLDWSIIKVNGAKTEKLQVMVVAVPNEIIGKYTEVAKLANLNVLNFEQEAFSLSRSLIGNDPKIYLMLDVGKKGSSIIIIDNGFVIMSHAIERVDAGSICAELKKVVDIYKMKYNKDIRNCVLTGGDSVLDDSPLLKNIKECLPEMEIIVGNPFARIDYAPQLEVVLKKLGPSLSVATGLAMREL